MKRIIALALCALLAFPATFNAVWAGAVTASMDTVQEVMYAMEVFTPGADLGAAVTRAELAKLLVSVSPQRTAVPAKSTTSPYKDVKFNHWAAPYVKVAASSGYLSAYPDGTFRPDQKVNVEDAVTGLLKVMGYSSADYGIDYPYGPMSYAAGKDFEMLDGVSVKTGSQITRRDLMRLTYNALDCGIKNGQGATLLSQLGYTRAYPDQPLDIESIEPDELDGPVSVQPGSRWTEELGVTAGCKVFRNDAAATLADVAYNDVAYYSKRENAIYAYSRSIAGVLESVEPRQLPSSVKVSGTTYSLEGELAQKAVSLSSSLRVGDAVLLVFGLNNKVADIRPFSSSYAGQYGFVVDHGREEFTEVNGGKVQSYYAVITTCGGDTVKYRTTNDAKDFKGLVVRISIKDGIATVEAVNLASSLRGEVDADNNTVGEQKIAPGASILELENGTANPVTLQRLDGMSGNSINVVFYTSNSKGQIECLFITDTTGDGKDYGIITSYTDTEGSISGVTSSSTVNYSINGAKGSFTTGKKKYTVGPNMFTKTNNAYTKAESLYIIGQVSLELTQVRSTSGAAFPLWDNVKIYDKTAGNGSYSDSKLISVEQARQLGNDVRLIAYYDKMPDKGGRVRVIIVEPATGS